MRDRSTGRRLTCNSVMPGVTARARCCPVVPAAVRTQRGPSRLGRVRHRRLTASDLPGAKGEAGTPVTVASLPGRRAGLEDVEKILTATILIDKREDDS